MQLAMGHSGAAKSGGAFEQWRGDDRAPSAVLMFPTSLKLNGLFKAADQLAIALQAMGFSANGPDSSSIDAPSRTARPFCGATP